MTENEYRERYSFLCEKKLSRTDAHLHRCFRNSVFAMDLLLANYINIFPFYTDHTFEHSEQVINYCNIIAGEDVIDALNPDEIYILLMGAALHDVGMGVSKDDFEELGGNIPELAVYQQKHPGESLAEYTRVFHQEFSARFVRKYRELLEIPSPEYAYCIAQVAKGHRKADLLDHGEYPTDFPLPGGRRVNLAYLAALVKLADELDVTSDRNLLFDYSIVDENWSEQQAMCYKSHGALKKLCFLRDKLVLYYHTDEAEVEEEILRTRDKVEETFGVYREVVEKRTGFQNRIETILFEKTAE